MIEIQALLISFHMGIRFKGVTCQNISTTVEISNLVHKEYTTRCNL